MYLLSNKAILDIHISFGGIITQRIRITNEPNVGEYTSPMDAIGKVSPLKDVCWLKPSSQTNSSPCYCAHLRCPRQSNGGSDTPRFPRWSLRTNNKNGPQNGWRLTRGDSITHFWGIKRYKCMVNLRDFPLILLMAEILHHLGCKTPFQ